jgi:hypothetical protein
MNIEITHHFKTTGHNLVELFENTNKLSTFMNKLERQSLLHPDRYAPNNYLGDGWEFLMEIFIKSRETDERIGISNYSPVKSNDDTGVDGTGINMSGDKCVIQHKYKANTTTLLTANTDHLSNMFSAAQTKYGVSTILSEKENIEKLYEEELISKIKYNRKIKSLEKSVKRHYVFTTAESLHYFTDSEMFSGQVVCYGYKELRVMLDNNISFWNLCRKLIVK